MDIKGIFEAFDGGNVFNLTTNKERSILFKAAGLTATTGQTLTEKIRNEMGKTNEYNEKIGWHPDFEYLDYGESENHYIVNVFADIQGSTNLVFKYDLETVKEIKSKILSTAIEIFQAFDGNIHRLQGDAIFTYFGGKNQRISDAIIDSLNAATILQVYINEYLKEQFASLGIDPVKVRIGIDLGYEDDVLWSKYGIKNCSEITTTSLHTDLAAKMQSVCSVNKIMIGENVKVHLDLSEELISVKEKQVNGTRVKVPYIIKNDQFRYRMWHFDWQKYFQSFHLYVKNNILNDISLHCKADIDKNGLYSDEYISNAQSLSKGVNLKFCISGLTNLYNTDVIWRVKNNGSESLEAGAIDFEMQDYRGKIYCEQSTAYVGHHYMECTVKRENQVLFHKFFGVYVNEA